MDAHIVSARANPRPVSASTIAVVEVSGRPRLRWVVRRRWGSARERHLAVAGQSGQSGEHGQQAGREDRENSGAKSLWHCQLPSGRPDHLDSLLAQRRCSAYYVWMRNTTIFLEQTYGARSAFCAAIGAELRARRLACRLSQRELATPLTAAYVSSVETGRVIPSLPALLMMLDRLGVSPPIYFEAVNCRLRRV